MIKFLRTLAYNAFPLYFKHPDEPREPSLLDRLDQHIEQAEVNVFEAKIQCIETTAKLAALEKILEDLEFQRGYYMNICMRRD